MPNGGYRYSRASIVLALYSLALGNKNFFRWLDNLLEL
jgi:hypothetical protein